MRVKVPRTSSQFRTCTLVHEKPSERRESDALHVAVTGGCFREARVGAISEGRRELNEVAGLRVQVQVTAPDTPTGLVSLLRALSLTLPSHRRMEGVSA